MKRILIALICLFALTASANDGVYYTSGNQIVPMQETDIRVTKEILTINLGDDGMADVDVYYELYNDGPQKTVLMGFEADSPYNAFEPVKRPWEHPFISLFSVEMNGAKLPYSTALYASNFKVGDEPLDMKEWKNFEQMANSTVDIMDDMLYNPRLDSACQYSHVYKFDATFLHGKNTVHHVYRYNMGMTICSVFELAYKLSPATRWANHQIDDFTLCITAKNTAKHFLIAAGPFEDGEFIVKKRMGKVRKIDHYEDYYYEVSLRDGLLEWHATDFCPTEELYISSADVLIGADTPYKLGAFYDRSANYRPELCTFDAEIDKDILRNLPYAHRGYMFKKEKYQKYFEQFWWYMPDAYWEPSTADFTPAELELIKQK